MYKRGLIRKKKKKWKKKKQISKWRRKLDVLRYFEVDVDDLSDIPNIFALLHEGIIPGYEYTARDVVTRLTFISFSWRHSMVNSVKFIRELFEYL